MQKKRLLVGSLVFVAGLISGGLSVLIYFGTNIGGSLNLMRTYYIAEWESRSFQAYTQEDPSVGKWALENLIDILEKDELRKKDKKMIETDLMLSYARLAKIYQAVGDKPKYGQNISKALALAKESSLNRFLTEKDLLNFVEQADTAGKKSLKQ